MRPPFQAITTKFLPITAARPARVKAMAEAGSMVFTWDHALPTWANHRNAAIQYAAAKGWRGEIATGCMHTGNYCHVFP